MCVSEYNNQIRNQILKA